MTQKQNTNDTITEILKEFCCCKYKREEEERRRRYEEWRKRKLGDCYAEKLDYVIGEIATATIGDEVLNVLKPGDRVLVAFDISDDPCMKKTVNGETYVEGYVPVYGKHCRCKRADFDTYAIVQLPLYIRGVLHARKYDIPPLSPEEQLSWYIYVKQLVVAEYKGDGILEIVDTDDYDYYLNTAILDIMYDIETEGATWHSIYYVKYNDTIYDQYGNKIAELGTCCYDEVLHYSIVLMLIKRNEVAKIRYHNGEKRLEYIVTATFPPVVKLRKVNT